MKLPKIQNIKPLNNLMDQFRALTSGKEKPLVGIDIGSYAVKLMHFSGVGGKTKLKSWAYRPYKFAQDAPASEKKVAITQTLHKLTKELDLTGKNCAVSISGNSVIIRYVAISKTNKKEVKKILTVEAEPFIPFDIKDVNLDCHILGDIKQAGKTKTEIILVAAKKDLVKSKLDLVHSAKLKPVVVDIDVFALESLCQKLKLTGDEGGILILNIGHKLTNLSIIEKSLTRVARDIVTSGQSFTKSIAKACDVDYEKAEALKKYFGITTEEMPPQPLHPNTPQEKSKEPKIEDTARHESKEKTKENIQNIDPEDEKYRYKVSDLLKQNLKDLSAEVKRSIDFYYSQGKDRSISKTYLAGGSSAMKNIDKFLESQLNMPVEVLNPCKFLGEKGTPKLEETALAVLSVASGLALRKIWDWV